MLRSLRQAFGRFLHWDRASKIAFLTAFVLLFPALYVASEGTEHIRQPATIGALGLVFAAQAIFMWANRGMVSSFTKAQRLYLNGDLEKTRDLLEKTRQAGKANFQMLTLLGNTYRQLGELGYSKAVLLEAIDIAPNHYFPRYGFGRTLLVNGEYADAVAQIQQALELGGQPIIQFDLGEALYRQGNESAAVAVLRDSLPYLDVPRRIMAHYLLTQVAADDLLSPSVDDIQEGLIYWQTQAELFAHTPYGIALWQDIGRLHNLIEGK